MDNDSDDVISSQEEPSEPEHDVDQPSSDEGVDSPPSDVDADDSDEPPQGESIEDTPADEVQDVQPQIPLPSENGEPQDDSSSQTSPQLASLSKKSMAFIIIMMFITSILAVAIANGFSDRDDGENDSQDDGGIFDLEYVPQLSDLPNCVESSEGRIILVLDDAILYTCNNESWDGTPLVPNTGDDSDRNSSNEPVTMIETDDVSPGGDCENGGVRILVGIDQNDDGILQSNEITSTTTICNGENGEDGSNGIDGADGQNGTNGTSPSNFLAQVSEEDPGINCQFGGSKVEYGFDVNSNQALDSNEIQSTTYICDSEQESNLSTPLFLTKSSPVSFNECTAGGQKIEQGFDDGALNATAMNGILEIDEVESTTIYCSMYKVEVPIEVNKVGPSFAKEFTSHGSTLYFTATDGNSGQELFAYDTDNESYWQVIDLKSGSSGSSPSNTVVIGDYIFFNGEGNDGETELWRYDLTSGLADQPVDYSGTGHSHPSELTKVDDLLIFSQEGGDSGNELYVINTTNGEDWMFDLETFPMEGSYPKSYTHIGSNVYFTATTQTEGRELWKYDLSSNTTSRLTDFQTGSNDGFTGEMVHHNEDLIFTGDDGVTTSIFKYNTTTAQIEQFQSIDTSLTSVSWLYVYGDYLTFIADDGVHGIENWVTSLEHDTTWMLQDIAEGSASSNSRYKIGFEDKLFFRADDSITGDELWLYDFITNQSIQLKNIDPTLGSSPRDFAIHNGQIYFYASLSPGVVEMMRIYTSIDIIINS